MYLSFARTIHLDQGIRLPRHDSRDLSRDEVKMRRRQRAEAEGPIKLKTTMIVRASGGIVPVLTEVC